MIAQIQVPAASKDIDIAPPPSPLLQDFGLTIDIEELIDGIDTEGSGQIRYDDFKELLTHAGGA